MGKPGHSQDASGPSKKKPLAPSAPPMPAGVKKKQARKPSEIDDIFSIGSEAAASTSQEAADPEAAASGTGTATASRPPLSAELQALADDIKKAREKKAKAAAVRFGLRRRGLATPHAAMLTAWLLASWASDSSSHP